MRAILVLLTMGIETFIKDQIRNRETRLHSPGFQAEMMREKSEFKDQLKKTGDSALDFTYTGIGKKFWVDQLVQQQNLLSNKIRF